MAEETDRTCFPVCVVYALPDQCYEYTVEVQAPATVRDAIEASGLLQDLPELSLAAGVGIFGRVCEESTLVQVQDRVEVYRDLELDPMQARRLRAQEVKR